MKLSSKTTYSDHFDRFYSFGLKEDWIGSELLSQNIIGSRKKKYHMKHTHKKKKKQIQKQNKKKTF
jgi:hypothetical protein